MSKVDRVDLLSAILILVIGAYFFIGAQEYRMGTVSRMGPGFVPYWLGLIAMGLGAAIGASALGKSSDMPAFSVRAAVSVLAAIGLFALTLPRFGLVPAVAIATTVSILGNPDARLVPSAITVLAITLMCWLLFLLLLGLPIPAFRLDF
jgi:hypothetical protein